MANVRVEKLTKIFKSRAETVVAVDDLNVEIPDQEFAVFVGPSGSGKSTFLRLVAGLEAVSSGRVFIGDQDVTTLHPRERGIAMVFQDYALYPHMNVAENMSFALQNLRYPKAEIKERVLEAARMLQIELLLERKPKELSGGQRQRVALGRAIVRKPQVFMFDEPLSNLDAKLRTRMRVELGELHAKLETTAIYVTHDQVEAMTLGNRIFVMDEGVIQQVGSGDELYRTPNNVFVATFIGTPHINLLPARLVAGENGLSLSLDGQLLPVSKRQQDVYGPWVEQDVFLGLRPELIRISTDISTSASVASLRARTRLVENLGSEKIVHFDLADETLVAKMDSDIQVETSENCKLEINIERIHLFDPETEKRIH